MSFRLRIKRSIDIYIYISGSNYRIEVGKMLLELWKMGLSEEEDQGMHYNLGKESRSNGGRKIWE